MKKTRREVCYKNIRQKRRARGISYSPCKKRDGNIRVAAQEMKPQCSETCKKICYDFLNEEQQQLIFDSFWSLEDPQKQRQYVSNNITVKEKERERKRGEWA